ncbi:hypothetical protein [Amycolatopsis sp. H20-H5]|uniref:hypothetical protein n=1 Tax=Amycolatopsis sp. H20-H5 TaxID=3046309 RepID=UPI002DBD4FE9|nr:hypothetical protein [Amycolatopsis sp. H20-H5]MEC3975113.1 hypothetical protein [Amycolatopsis sp. H20-H5]
MRNRVLAVAGVAAAVLAVAGCSTAKDGVPSAALSSAPTATSGAGSASATPTEQASTGGDFTKQGSKLKLGDKAVVPFKSSEKTGSLGITVKAIEKGAESDLAELKLGDKAKGMTPYYVRVVISNESGTDFAYSSLSGVDGTLADGSEAQGVSVIGKFEKCDSGSAKKDFTTKGATYESCELALATGTAAVTGASYGSGSYSKQAPDTDYSDEAIVWQ